MGAGVGGGGGGGGGSETEVEKKRVRKFLSQILKFISISLAKQMRKNMYNRALFILHTKRQNLTFFTTSKKKEVFDSHSKENHFFVEKMPNFLSIVLFTRKLKILVLSYSTLISLSLCLL